MPEAVAAMMIYGFCTIKYSDPKVTDEEAMRQLLQQRGFSAHDIGQLMARNTQSLFRLINGVLSHSEGAQAHQFSRSELESFVENICVKSPIFHEVQVR